MRSKASFAILILVFAALVVVAKGVYRRQSNIPVANKINDTGKLFVDISSDSGLAVTHGVWPPGTFKGPEIFGPGVALFDYDNDGDLDILQIVHPHPGELETPAPNRLFQQTSTGEFVEVSEQSGVADPGYGQAVAIGDVNNDGREDVFVANYGPDALYLNRGDGTFENMTESSKIAGDAWSLAAAFLDYDRDGDLDLFVVSYLDHNWEHICEKHNGGPEYCGPQHYKATLDSLFRNDGSGGFVNVTEDAGIDSRGRGMGVVCADLNGDDWVDVYVANDTDPNHLWINQKNGTFRDESVGSGVAYNSSGFAESSMGVALGDVDLNGRLDLFLTHLTGESNTLYLSTSVGLFADRSAAGLAGVDLAYTGFGCGFLDYDHDGDLDLAVANGRVAREPRDPNAIAGPFWDWYAEPNLLLENTGNGRFVSARDRAGSFAVNAGVSRGLAFGDVDQDGDMDMVLSDVGGQARLYRNDAPTPGSHWIRVRPKTGKRAALGAMVEIRTTRRTYKGVALAAYSYASSSDPVVHFGLGADTSIDSIQILWPDGQRERFEAGSVDQELVLRQGDGTPL
jgi:hypothetical protein